MKLYNNNELYNIYIYLYTIHRCKQSSDENTRLQLTKTNLFLSLQQAFLSNIAFFPNCKT